MATIKRSSLLFVLCLTHSATSFQWTSGIKDDAANFVCHGKDLILPWNFTASNENPYSILWYYRGLSEELIATMAHGNFVPSAAFSGRVEYLPLAGIILKNIIPGDKGNYSVEVLSHAGITERQNAFVEISDAPITSSGNLDVQQDRAAIHTLTGDWSIQLTCGHFTSLGQPPVNVVWTTPTGGTQQSTNYNGGNFHLILPNPVRGGNYSCAIAPQSPAASCLPGSSPLLRKAVVNVDEYGARLTLIEARQVELLAGNQLQSETNANQSSYNHYLEDRDANLTSQIHYLENKDANLTSQIHSLQEAIGEIVCSEMYHTVLSEDWRATSHPRNASDLHCDTSLPAGWYRFKLNGANAVIPTSCVQFYHCGTDAPSWLDLQGQSLPGVGQQVTGQTCGSSKQGSSGDCCHSGWSSGPATVRNCGTFYVYNLQPAPVCGLAYCTTSH